MDVLALLLVAGVVTVAAGAVVLVRARSRSPASEVDVARLAEVAAHAAAAEARQCFDRALAHARASNEELLDHQRRLTVEQLDGRRAAFEERVGAVAEELGRVRALVREFEDQRGAKLDRLAGQLHAQQEGIAALATTTQSLREALVSTKVRGQWGERMAEDVLRLAGFLEDVQYRKQAALGCGRGIPDFTFLLPQGQVLYMDVKFPLDNYLRFLDAATEPDRRRFRDDFLRDVRAKVKELAGREYASASSSLDCVLLFIPNEQLYAFIQEQDGAIFDEALRRQIVFCSPLTLFAVLAVIRQAIDSFRVERTAKEILTVLGGFQHQWEAFVGQMDKLGGRIDGAAREFEALVGTRRRMLERQIDRVEMLRAGGGGSRGGGSSGAELPVTGAPIEA